MKLQELMIQTVIQAAPDETVAIAAHRMREQAVGCLVVTSAGAVKGIAPRGGGSVPVCFEEWLDTPIYQRAVLAAGQRVAGPAVIEEVDSTTVVPPGWTAEVHASGCLVLHA